MIPVFIALALASPARQEGDPFGVEPTQDGRRLAVYLVTFGPGPRIWERFGHNAILIRDTVTGEGVAYDYGRFSFDEKRFFIGFARGRMQYWMGREDGVALINAYVRRQRSAWMQQLALGPAERIRLRELLEADYERDRGRYRYDYYRDNCSTRLRDAIDQVAGGAIRATLDSARTSVSYRWHTRRSLQNNPLNYFAVDAGLGPAADLPVTRYQETFLPGKLREYLGDITIRAPDGSDVPLLKGEIALSEADEFPVPAAPSNLTIRFIAVGAVLGGVLLLLGRGVLTTWARVAFGFLASTWALGAALGGAILAFLAFFSEHSIAYRNENLWQFNLLAVALLPVLPGALRGEPFRSRVALTLAWLVVIGSVVGLLLKVLPGHGQANGEIIGLALPLHLGLAGGLTAALKSRSRVPS